MNADEHGLRQTRCEPSAIGFGVRISFWTYKAGFTLDKFDGGGAVSGRMAKITGDNIAGGTRAGLLLLACLPALGQTSASGRR
jgi:hypothetical protein